jgi:hypothetical protein
MEKRMCLLRGSLSINTHSRARHVQTRFVKVPADMSTLTLQHAWRRRVRQLRSKAIVMATR